MKNIINKLQIQRFIFVVMILGLIFVQSYSAEAVRSIGESNTFSIDTVKGPGIIWGTVRNASTVEAIPNVTIQVDGADSTNTDAEGKYSLTLLEGTYTLGAIAEGYVPFEQAVTVPSGGSKVQVDIQLYPVSAGELVPKVYDVISRYCDETRKAYFLDGISVDISFKAVVDWGDFEPDLIRFVTPKDTYEGLVDTRTFDLVDTRTFDVGTEFGVGGQLQVIAVAQDGTESEPYIANFEVIPIPPGIPPDPVLLIPKPALNPQSGHVLKYGSSLGWDFTAIDEGVEKGTVPEDIPGFGGKAFKFVAEMELGVEITSAGEAKAWVTKPLDEFEIAGCTSTPTITAEVVWKYKGYWVPGGGICIALNLDCTTDPYYFTIPVGPIPVPGYWRAGVEASLDTCVELIGWLSESSPELKGDISLEALGKFILGVGWADVIAVEGELKGGPNLTLQYPAEPHLASLVIHIEGTARVVVLFFKWSPGSITYDWELIGAESAIQAMRLTTLPPLEEFQPLERDYLNEGYPMFVGNNQPAIFSQAGAFSGENTIVINEYPYSDPDLVTQDGGRMLVWLTDDPLRSDNNRTKALWSMGEGGGFETSTPCVST